MTSPLTTPPIEAPKIAPDLDSPPPLKRHVVYGP